MSPSSPASSVAYVALGSNLGERGAYLERALQALGRIDGIVVQCVSSFHETAPVGGPSGQSAYLNAAAQLETTLSPEKLLQAFLDVERALGRVRTERFGPRTIDLDLLLYDQRILYEPELLVPHPRMHERRFVLAPLAEIAPEVVHPVANASIAQLLARLSFEARGSAGGSPELLGKKALVTGATSGIGRAIAHELAAGGADVIVHGRRSDAAEEVRNRINAHGVRTATVLEDLHAPDPCRRLVDRAWGTWDGLDIWINNAGADTLTGEAAGWAFERKLTELWAVDVAATMLLCRAVGERMHKQGGGVILTMGWDQAETGMAGDSGQLFAAVKAAVMAFTKSLALTLAPVVRVNGLAPGWIKTAWGNTASATWQERVLRETLLGRWGTPEDVAKTARWLVSPAAAFITGQIIRVNGGAVR